MTTTCALSLALASLVLLAGCEREPPAPPLPLPAPSASPGAGAPRPDRTTDAPPAAPADGPVLSAPPPIPPPTPSSAPAALTVADLTFPIPGGWRQAPPANPMRLAELHVPGPAGDASRECLITFSTAGGDAETNIARWAAQVRGADGRAATPDTQIRTIAGRTVHLVELTGAYAGMGESPLRPDWTLRGAIIAPPSSSPSPSATPTTQLLFVKMTGPADRMRAAGAAFESMIEGLAARR